MESGQLICGFFNQQSIFRPSFQLRDHVFEDFDTIGDDFVVGDAENGRFRIGVDGNDGLRAANASQVLNGAGDAKGDEELR